MRVTLGVLVLIAASAFGRHAEGAPARVALVVGNNVADSSRARLRYAEADAQEVRSVLEGLGGVTRTVSLLDSSARGLDQAFDELERELAGGHDEVTFLFFYSGHADEGAILMRDSRYEFDRLRDRLAQMPARLVVAMVDACYAGHLTRGKGGVPVPITDVDLRDVEGQLRGNVFISSTAPGEAAQESDALGASFFTHYLVSALRGAADDSGDGQVSLDEAYRFVYRHTLDRTKSTLLGPQHPSYRFEVEGQGDLVLSWLEAGRSYIVLPAGTSGRYFLRPSRGGVVTAEVEKELPGPLRIAVAPGRYEVSRVRGAYEHVQELEVEAGEERVVDEGQMTRRRLESTMGRGADSMADLRLAASYELGSGYLEQAGPRNAGSLRFGLGLGAFEVGGLLFGGGGSYRRDDGLEVDLFELGGGLFAYWRRWLGPDFRLRVGPELKLLYVSQRARRSSGEQRVEAPVVPAALRLSVEVPLDGGFGIQLGGSGGAVFREGPSGLDLNPLASLDLGVSWSW